MTSSKRPTLIVTCLATAMLMLDIAVVNTAMPHIGGDLHAGLDSLKWVVDAYTLALATTVLTVGSLADRFGRRNIFAAGLVVFTVASLACALADSIAMLDAARVVQGIGASGLFASSLALLVNAFPEARERNGAMAVYGATIGASFAVGPLVGGALTSGLSWRWIFLINLPIGIGALAVTLRRVAESKDPAARRVDVPGQVALTGGLFLLVLALLRANDVGLGRDRDDRRARRRRRAAARLRRHRAPRARADAAARPVPHPGVRRRADHGVRDLGLVLRGLPVRDAVHAGRARPVGDRGRPGLPARHGDHVLRRPARRAQLVERVAARVLIAGGLALVAAGMALMTIAQADSSWTIILPGFLLASVGTGPVQPGAQRRRDEQRPDRDERPGRRRQRHGPPGRHRCRHRGARRADPVRGACTCTTPPTSTACAPR